MKPLAEMTLDEVLAESARRNGRREKGLPLHETPEEVDVNVKKHNAEVDARLEKAIQFDVVKLYLHFSCLVYNLSQARASKQSPGLADIYVMHLRSKNVWWHETKTPTGKQRPAQREFQVIHKYTPVGYVVGGVAAAEEHLVKLGIVERVNGTIEPVR